MSQTTGCQARVDKTDWTVADLPSGDAPRVTKFDYQELRETLEAIVSSMKSTTVDIEILPPESSTGS